MDDLGRKTLEEREGKTRLGFWGFLVLLPGILYAGILLLGLILFLYVYAAHIAGIG